MSEKATRKFASMMRQMRRIKSATHSSRSFVSEPLINTSLQRGDRRQPARRYRFNGFEAATKTAKAVPASTATPFTSLKQGVNERTIRGSKLASEMVRFTHLTFLAIELI